MNGVASSVDGQLAVSASGGFWDNDNTLKIWDVATGRELRTLTGHSGWVKRSSTKCRRAAGCLCIK